MRALLDVNVLIALLDPNHTFHERAHLWWGAKANRDWASCPLVENGFVRIMSHPGYSVSRRFTVTELVEAISQFVLGTDHEFWPDDLTLRSPGVFASERIHGGKALTDIYLLALASNRGGCLITFDRGIPLSAVRTAHPENLVTL